MIMDGYIENHVGAPGDYNPDGPILFMGQIIEPADQEDQEGEE